MTRMDNYKIVDVKII